MSAWRGRAILVGVATKGSWRAFRSKSTGKQVFVNDNPQGLSWELRLRREMLKTAPRTRGAEGEVLLLRGPVGLALDIYLPRPKSHFGTGRNATRLRANAPTRPTSTPDADKVLRAVQDAAQGAWVWDDAQFVEVEVSKSYAEGGQARVEVEAWSLEVA